MEPAESFEQRAARRRRTWTARLGREQVASQAADSTVAERVEHLMCVSESAWAFAGRELPDYTREEMPGLVIRDP